MRKRGISIILALAAGTSFARSEVQWPRPLITPETPYNDQVTGMIIENDRAYLSTATTLAVFDVSNPASPQFLGSDTAAENLGLRLTDFDVQDGIAYVTDGLEVIDARQPGATRFPLLGTYPPLVSHHCSAVAASGEFVFCSGYGEPLSIFRFSDPETLIAAGGAVDPDASRSEDFFANDIKIVGDLIYLAGGDDDWGAVEIYRFNPSDPEEPGVPIGEFLGDFRVLGGIDFPPTGTCIQIEVKDNVAFVADTGAGLFLLDVSDPTQPTLIDRPSALPTDIAVSGNFLFTGNLEGELQIFDVTNPAAPSLIRKIDVGGRIDQIEVVDDLVYFASSHLGLVIYDIADPSTPFEVGFFEIEGERYQAVASEGKEIYLALDLAMTALDISDPSSPTWFGSAGEATYERIEIIGSHAVAKWAHSKRLSTFDISPGLSPQHLRDHLRSNLEDFAVEGENLLLAEGYDGLTINQISQSGGLPNQGRWSLPSSRVSRVVAENDRAYVRLGSHPSGTPAFHVLDYSDPSAITAIATPDLPNFSLYQIRDGLLYTGSWPSFSIYDLNDPNNPITLGSFSLLDTNIQEIVLSGDHAYLREGYPDMNIRVVDISNPNQPYLVTKDVGFGNVHDLSLNDDQLILARGELGLQILDLTLPELQLAFTNHPPQLTWNHPPGMRHEIQSSRDLRTWISEGTAAADALQEIFEDLLNASPSRPIFLRPAPTR